MTQTVNDERPAGLAGVALSPNGHYTARWRYRRRFMAGASIGDLPVCWEEHEIVRLSYKVAASTVPAAYEGSAALARAEYRGDADRIEGTLNFDEIAAFVPVGAGAGRGTSPAKRWTLVGLALLAGAGLAVLAYRAL